ncbi:MAG: alanine racemase, partial [Coriobacteriaceae bacterium]|nr:alanine racemase [Coriobacteriaceae bacterium]
MEEILNGFTGFAKKNSGFTMPKNARTPEGTVVAFGEQELESIDDRDRRWSWVEINLRAIQQNTLNIKRLLRPDTKLMAVVKADAYGHGAVRCAKASLSAGADWLGVSTVNEGIELRNAGLNAP